MSRALWFTAGVAAGFAVAHVVSRTPQGAALFADLDDRITGLATAVADGYRSREAELRGGDADDSARP